MAEATVSRLKKQGGLVDQIEDDAPAKVLGRSVQEDGAAAVAYPWAFLVKHPSFGALRIRKVDAKTETEAAEAYRQKRCPHMKLEQLGNTGLRVSPLKFTPAETER